MVLVVLPVLAGLFSYLVVPAAIEDQVARRLQEALGLPAEPDVEEVSSNFPPEMLLGNVDRIRIRADRINLQGLPLGNLLPERRGTRGVDRPRSGVPRLPGASRRVRRGTR